MKAADLAALCPEAKRQSDGSYNVRCPAHNDGRPSCNIADGEKGLLLHCYAGCEYKEIRAGFAREGKMEERSEYVPEERIKAFSSDWMNPRIHIYRDAAGEIKYYIHRMPDPDQDGDKTFRQFRANGSGTFIPGMKDIPRIPYNWHLLHDQPTLFIVEGEQAADAMLGAGYPATTNPGGSSLWQPELTPYFAGKRVIIIPDNDAPGAKHAAKVAEALQGVATYTIISPLCQGMHDAADIVDWMQQHPQDIKRIYDLTLAGESTSGRQYRNLSQMKYELEANWTIRDLFPGEGMGAIYGQPGSGKTFWTLDAALSIACGKGYKTQQTKHGGVVYFALEGGRLFDNRCLKWCQKHDITSLDQHPFEVTSDPLDLLVKGSESEVDRIIADIEQFQKKWGQPTKLVIIDTLNRAMAGGNENAPEDMGALVANADRIWKALGCFLLIVHHSGKDVAKGLRGHSSLLAAVNTEIQLTLLAGTDFSQAEVLKQRDGESGKMHCFSLESQTVGVDSDGYEVTTCTVNHVDGEEAGEARSTAATEDRSEPRGKHQRPVYNALKALLVLKGESRMPSDGYPFVRCVSDEAFKTMALPALDADSGHRSTLFDNAVRGLIKAGRINQIGGYTWIT